MYTIAIVDENNHGQPLLQGLLFNEKESTLKLFLEKVYEWLNTHLKKNLVILLDKDWAEIEACKSVFVNKHSSTILLCRFHIMKAFHDAIKKIKLSTESSKIVTKVNTLLKLIEFILITFSTAL